MSALEVSATPDATPRACIKSPWSDIVVLVNTAGVGSAETVAICTHKPVYPYDQSITNAHEFIMQELDKRICGFILKSRYSIEYTPLIVSDRALQPQLPDNEAFEQRVSAVAYWLDTVLRRMHLSGVSPGEYVLFVGHDIRRELNTRMRSSTGPNGLAMKVDEVFQDRVCLARKQSIVFSHVSVEFVTRTRLEELASSLGVDALRRPGSDDSFRFMLFRACVDGTGGVPTEQIEK